MQLIFQLRHELLNIPINLESVARRTERQSRGRERDTDRPWAVGGEGKMLVDQMIENFDRR